jgi:hypothetical protein
MKYTSVRILTGVLLSIIFTLTILSSSGPKAVANFEDDLRKSTTQVRENTRIIERIGDFLEECTLRLKSTDTTLISICDSFVQKHNVDMSKFSAENQAAIEELIYPYTIPSNTQGLLGLNSSSVTGSNDLRVASEHGSLAASFMELGSKLTDECISRGELYDISAVKTCNSIFDSLNKHLREFNENTKIEFERVLGTALP